MCLRQSPVTVGKVLPSNYRERLSITRYGMIDVIISYHVYLCNLINEGNDCDSKT